MNRRFSVGAAGVAGAAAALAAAGGTLIVERVLRARAARAGDLHSAERFGEPAPESSIGVVAQDGVVLPVDRDGPSAAALTVVFIHGYGLDRATFHFQRRALLAEFHDRLRLIQYDQRGHGQAQRGSADRATVRQLAADLATVLDGAAPHGPVMLVGHSMGGMAVLGLAQERPELFGDRIVAAALIATPLRGLPLMGPGLRGPASRSAGLTGWLVARRMSVADRMVSPAVTDFLDGVLARSRAEAVADFHPALASFDGSSGLSALNRIHVALLAGREDRLVPVARVEELDSALANSELHIMADAGHVLMVERPQDVNGVLIEMVRENLVRRSTGARRAP